MAYLPACVSGDPSAVSTIKQMEMVSTSGAKPESVHRGNFKSQA